MTLVVARIDKRRIAIASDTLVTEHGKPLPYPRGVLKSCMLPGHICVSFCNSPELAARAFQAFRQCFPHGTIFSSVVSFFEESSRNTGNDYIISFSDFPKIIKIAEGKRAQTAARTLWIGDRDAYERFREYEARKRPFVERGRAINAALFADEIEGSPASDLYSVMRHVVADREISSIGGFVTVVSNRDPGFRFSVYSDMLYDWPTGVNEEYNYEMAERRDFNASGENLGYSVTQISSSYAGLNAVAFYFVRGKTLFVFWGNNDNGLADKCYPIRDIEPNDIKGQLDHMFREDWQWLVLVTSSRPTQVDFPSLHGGKSASGGAKLGMFVEANTLPKPIR